MKKFLNSAILSILASTMLLTSCSDKLSKTFEEELTVYTSFSAMTAITKPLLSNNANLVQLTNGSVEPHDFEPSARDIVSISEANLFIYNGLGFEHYIDKVEASVDESVHFINSAENITYTTENEYGVDTHIWLNFDNVIAQVTKITDSLIQVDLDNEDVYRDNRTAFVANIETLRSAYDKVLSEYADTVVVLHPAYAYIFEPYDIKQLAIQQNHDVEPTISELKEVIDYINENNVKYVFASSEAESKPLNTIVSETNVEVLVLNSMENINVEDITTNTYLEVMTENLESLKKLNK